MYRNSGHSGNYSQPNMEEHLEGIVDRNGYYNKNKRQDRHSYFNGPRHGDDSRHDPIFGDDPENFQSEKDGWISNYRKRSHERDEQRYHEDRSLDRNFKYGDGRVNFNKSKSRSPHQQRSRSPRRMHENRGKSRSSSRHRQEKLNLYDALPGIKHSAVPRGLTPRRSLSKKKSSESSSGDSSSSDSEPAFPKKNRLGDDFFKSMYSRAKEDIREDIPEKINLKQKQLRRMSQEQSFPSAQIQLNVPPGIDDEETYLYGRRGLTNQQERLSKELREAPDPKITPGGFDSNALQNVLKAIGFNFEMSAQSQEKFLKDAAKATGGLFENISTAITPEKSKRAPERVTAIEDAFDSQHPHSAAVGTPVTPIESGKPKRNYSPYTQVAISKFLASPPPKNKKPSVYTQPKAPEPLEFLSLDHYKMPVTTSRQVPPRPRQDNFLQNVQPLQRKPSRDLPAVTVSNAHQVQPSTSAGAPPLEFIPPNDREPQTEARKKRLDYLETTLKRLKNQQADLFRKKRKEYSSGHKNPLITKNNMLQAEVENEIKKIRKVAEVAAGIVSDDGEKIGYEFFDPGNHWCKLCNVVCSNLYDYLTHLHSKPHRKSVDPYDRPWMGHGKEDKNNKPAKTVAAPIKGYYCSLCDMFSGDHTCAEDHCKTENHHLNFKKYCRDNPAYEENRKLDMAAALSNPLSRKTKSERNHDKHRNSEEKSKSRKHRKSPKEVYVAERSPSPKPQKHREPKSSKSRKSRWSPGYDDYEKMQNAVTNRQSTTETEHSQKPIRTKRWDEDVEGTSITDTVDMDIEDSTPAKSHKINMDDGELVERRVTTTTVISTTSHNKSKIAIPFSVNKQEKAVRQRAESTSSTKSNDSTEKSKTKEPTKPKLTAESVRKQNALRAKLSAITVPSSRTAKKSVGLKRPATVAPQNIKFKAIVKQREELAKVAQKSWGPNYNAFGGMMQYNYSMMSQGSMPPAMSQGSMLPAMSQGSMPPAMSQGSMPLAMSQGVTPLPMSQGSIPGPQATLTDPTNITPNLTSVSVSSEIIVEKPTKKANTNLENLDNEPPPDKEMEEDKSIIDDEKEPPPPGEDGFDVGDDSASDASGISMEIASDED